MVIRTVRRYYFDDNIFSKKQSIRSVMYYTSETSNDAICVHRSRDFEVSKFIPFRDIVTQYISIIIWIYYKLAHVQVAVV